MDNSTETNAAEVPQRTATKRKYRKLTLMDQVLVFKLSDKGLSNIDITRRTGIDERVVSRILKTRDITALDILKTGERKAAGAWLHSITPAAAKGDHRAARDLLLHTKAIEPIKTEPTTGITIQLGIAILPGTESPNLRDLQIQIPQQTNNAEPERE